MVLSLNLILILLLAPTIIIAAKTGSYLAEKPAYVQLCHLSDPNFRDCFTANIQVLFTQWKDGVPGLKSLGSLDPLNIKRIKIAHNSGNNFVLNADLTDVVLTGASRSTVKSANIDFKKLKAEASIFVPKMQLISNANVKGRILAFNLNGDGKVFIESENVLLNFYANIKLREEHGYTFIDVQNVQAEIKDIGNMHMKLENIFGGQKELEDSANEIFNANWRELYTVFGPVISETIQAVIYDRLKKVFNYVPSSYFISDIPSASG